MTVVVVAAVIRDREGRVLLSQRPPGKHLAGTWEFPGGKLEAGETPAAGLVRELAEELGIRVRRSSPLLSLTHTYPEKTVRLLLRLVEAWDGEPGGREGQPLSWFEIPETFNLAMPAADRPMLKALALDPCYAISADPELFSSQAAFLADWEARLAAGWKWLELRAPSLDPDRLQVLARECGRLARRYPARWLIRGAPELALDSGADGVHLGPEDLARCQTRPLPEQALVCASCRDPSDLARAGRLGLDFVIVSPVLVSEPDAGTDALGWSELARLCALSPLPVLAHGGLNPGHLELAREHGAFGVAGIDGFGG